ncbi:LITAF-like zinc finger domain-containing protein [Colletotrichum orchidophilum]|uniref:LITAF-like zinc finger domain-containing protein n=1 Tax=Colletotrichum orchidophilum TaxID=1209926 RepID=A0A1G4B0L2_9PEZI|nr:LITAF-like zinc finger domain-containing protein [Colletotrichum orchidophilum]OHE94960.1 LITAF-like zinc finger domain-containing protein [Colletotrichum orchidophilum]
MGNPTQQPATSAPAYVPTPDANPSDNYVASDPPPEYRQHVNQQPTGTSMPKYGGPAINPPPPPQNYDGGYAPPLQGGPQNFQPYGTPLPSLGPHPAPVACPECHARGITSVEYTSGGFTHSLAAICGIPLATYHRSGRTEVHWHQAYNG